VYSRMCHTPTRRRDPRRLSFWRAPVALTAAMPIRFTGSVPLHRLLRSYEISPQPLVMVAFFVKLAFRSGRDAISSEVSRIAEQFVNYALTPAKDAIGPRRPLRSLCGVSPSPADNPIVELELRQLDLSHADLRIVESQSQSRLVSSIEGRGSCCRWSWFGRTIAIS